MGRSGIDHGGSSVMAACSGLEDVSAARRISLEMSLMAA